MEFSQNISSSYLLVVELQVIFFSFIMKYFNKYQGLPDISVGQVQLLGQEYPLEKG